MTNGSQFSDELTAAESLSIGESMGIDAEKAQKGARLLLESVGEDPASQALADTWQRRVPAMLETLSEGKRHSEKPTIRTFESSNTELVVKTGIPLYSLCEHHLLPYHGTVSIGYRPDGQAVGLSQLIRYVRWQSRRLTMQEGLTSDIAEGLADELDVEVVLVEVASTHLCEAMRGIETETTTTTRSIIGSPTGTEYQRFTNAISSDGDLQ
jgi:GTP cyclohydrolase I